MCLDGGGVCLEVAGLAGYCVGLGGVFISWRDAATSWGYWTSPQAATSWCMGSFST